jgi:hypothetical protein
MLAAKCRTALSVVALRSVYKSGKVGFVVVHQ